MMVIQSALHKSEINNKTRKLYKNWFKTVKNIKWLYIKYSAVSWATVLIQQICTAKQMSFASDLNVANVLAHLIYSGSWFQLRAAK